MGGTGRTLYGYKEKRAVSGFLPCSLLETEGREKRVVAGWEVSCVPPAGPQQGLIAIISTSCLVEQQGQLSHGFLITNFRFLHRMGDGIN